MYPNCEIEWFSYPDPQVLFLLASDPIVTMNEDLAPRSKAGRGIAVHGEIIHEPGLEISSQPQRNKKRIQRGLLLGR